VRSEPPGHVWIDDRLAVGDSRIAGRGLFFAEDVPQDTVVVRLGGTLVTSIELERLIAAAVADPALPYVDTITVYDDAHLVLPAGTPVHFGNHSCDPTLWHVGPYELATRYDVHAGEEATIDYATQSGAAGMTAFEADGYCITTPTPAPPSVTFRSHGPESDGRCESERALACLGDRDGVSRVAARQ